MATYQQRKPGVDPQTGLPLDTVETASPNVHVNQSTTPESGMTGIIIAVVVVLIGAILAFNYGWFDGSTAPNVTQNNTTETVPQATTTDTTTTTVTEPDSTTSTTTGTGATGTSNTGTGTSTTTTTDP